MLLFMLALPVAADAASYTPPASNRATVTLSGTWRFLRADSPGSEAPGFDDSAWSSVAVPHTWNNVDGQDGPGTPYYRGIGRYRRHFNVPTADAGRRLFVQFEGSNLVTEVWVNGIYAGHHEGGFTTFRFDVTAMVDFAAGNDNVIAVKVDNSNSVGIAPLSGDFTSFGGIYRDVSLVATDRLSAEMLDYGSAGVYLTQTNVSHAFADLEIKTLVYNAHTSAKTFALRTVLVDAAANIVATRVTRATLAASAGGPFVQNLTITNPHLWDGRSDPYLYSVYVEIHDGDETGPVRDLAPPQPLGFRSYYLDPDQGFFLNGHYLDLHGVNRHQDRLNKGWAIAQSDHDQDMALIEEVGATAVRLAHYPHAQYFYSLADKNGVIVWAELPIVNGVGGSGFTANAAQQLTELIRQNYNHPAIVFWSIANEVKLESWRPDPTATLTYLNGLAKHEDPYRITTLASCCVDSDTADPTTTMTDTVAYNHYFGWYYGSYDDFGPWADATHNAKPARSIAVSEYGAGASVLLHAENPALSHTEEYQAKFHEAHWLAMKTRRYLWGKFVWNMFDFASDSRTEGDTNGRNDKGLVTYDRATRKDAFYWYKANWTTAPMVYITSRRWTERTVSTTNVKIYSNADSVELFVNGVSLGTRTATANPDSMFTWRNVLLNGGANSVQAIGSRGGVTVTDTVQWNVNGIAPDSLPPTIATPAAATPSLVTATATALSVLGADDGGESKLTYVWTTTGTPPAPVSFSVNGTNAAKNSLASFARAGSYTFRVTVQDAGGRTATSSVAVTVTPTLTSIRVSPATAAIPKGATQPFTASAADQFAITLTSQPAFTWSATGGGIIDSTGLFTAGQTLGSGFTVSAAAAGHSGAATVSVVAAAGFSAAINFQPASAPAFPGYVVDGGVPFGDRGNGLTYGWSQDATAAVRDRNSALSLDQRYDTLIHMGTLTWEIAVPNGTYSVHAVVGDPSYFDVSSTLTIEGILAINGLTSGATPWLEGTATVTVNDGRLTVGNQAGSYNKICFIEIVAAAPTPPSAAAIRLDVGNGVAFTDSAGAVWQADQYGVDGTISSKPNAVDSTVDDDLYRTYRYGNFTYAIPVPNGTYDVTIKCIETWWSSPGQRVFSVSAEGSTKLANVDLFAIAGKFTAVERTFSVTVADGVLNLSFTASVDNAIVSAIAIVPRQ
jgi:beta-galactosidase